MMTIRKATDRGHANHGWLDSHHTFSFASYRDPAHMGFRTLRVINDDRVTAGQGFGAHSHSDMEIVSYVLEGALAHKDSMGTGAEIKPADVQLMSAGTGVTHSEFNASKHDGVHFLQIWLLPKQQGVTPRYEQKTFPEAEKRGTLRLVASPDGAAGSLTINSDAKVYAGLFTRGESTTFEVPATHGAWIQVARGTVRVNGAELREGDGAAFEGEPRITIDGVDNAEILAFDLV